MTNSQLQWRSFRWFALNLIVGLAVVGPYYGMPNGLRIGLGVIFGLGAAIALITFIRTWKKK